MMKEFSNKNGSIQSFKTDSGKTRSTAIPLPSIDLLKDGKALKNINENFSVNTFNGTSPFSMLIFISPARITNPELNLSSNSGSVNGVFGLGWDLKPTPIKRKAFG